MARPIRRSPSAVLAIQAKKKRYKHQANKAKGRTREKEARDESQPEVKTNGNSGSSTAKKTQQKWVPLLSVWSGLWQPSGPSQAAHRLARSCLLEDSRSLPAVVPADASLLPILTLADPRQRPHGHFNVPRAPKNF